MNDAMFDRFMRFYREYPRKKKPRDAEKAFRAISPSEDDVTRWLETLAWQKREWVKRGDPQFIPYPATYLRAGQYDDEPEPSLVEPQCPRFTGLDDDVRAKERLWRKNIHMSKAEVEMAWMKQQRERVG